MQFMKYLRYLLMAAAAVVFAAAGVAAYIGATFDPNAYKPQIIRLVQEKKQRTLKLDGDIKLAFWPALGADLGSLSLSEFGSGKEFAAVESARVSLALIPLLSKKLVVNEVVIKGLRANIVRFKDGRTNIDDLLARDETQQPFKFDIDHVAIDHAALNFRDDATGAQYALSNIHLKTGRIADGVPAAVAVSLAIQGNQPRLSLEMGFKARLTFELEPQIYTLEDLVLEAKGQAVDISDLAAKIAGSVTAKVKTREFTADRLSVAMTGVSGKNNLDIKLDAPRLRFTNENASGEKVTLAAKVTNPQRSISANLGLPGIAGTAQSFKSDLMTLDLDMKQGGLTVKAKGSSPLSGNFEARQVDLPKLTASVSANGPGLPGKGVSGEFAGGISVDAAKQDAQSSLTGKVGDSNVKAHIGVANFAAPVIRFDIDIDQLDVDRYLPPRSASAQKQPEQPFDLSGLGDLGASGTLHIGSLKASGVKASNVRFEIKADGERGPDGPKGAVPSARAPGPVRVSR